MSASGKNTPVSERTARRRGWWSVRKPKEEDEEPKLNKGRSSKKHKKKLSVIKTEDSEDASVPAEPTNQEAETNPDKKKKQKCNKHYVLFVGNLPYNVTEEEIAIHFDDTGGVKEVRLLTNKETGKSRGCAYVEFSSQQAHEAGIKHHNSKLHDRRINVEFTSAGRKTEKREQRLKTRNNANTWINKQRTQKFINF